jgi:hypothetical protein
MDSVRNPFSPSAGRRPPELAGRDEVIESAQIAAQRVALGKYARPTMLLGLRGTGKTVLLNEFGKIGQQHNVIVSKIEAPEQASLAKLIIPEMRRILRSLSTIEAAKHLATKGLRGLRNFASILKIEVSGIGIGIEGASDPEPGLADSGDIQFDLPELFVLLGEAAQSAGKGWLLLIDEVQYLNEDDLSALIVALHKVSQSDLPIAFAGAGLPQVARLAGEAKSYAERLFTYPKIGPLERQAAEIALIRPINAEGAQIEAAAVKEIVDATQGYPFFLQEWGAKAWDTASGPSISLDDARLAGELATVSLDEGFFKVRLDRLTRAETIFVIAMAQLGNDPVSLADIAKKLGRKPQSLSPARASIIHKGMIFSAEHGYLEFTVPLFADFMRRHVSKGIPVKQKDTP